MCTKDPDHDDHMPSEELEPEATRPGKITSDFLR